MAIRLLVVGAASNGPTNTPFLPATIRELNTTLGGAFTERFAVSPVASGVTLMYTPWAVPTNEVNGKENALYRPTASGVNFFFGSLGQVNGPGSGETLTLDVTYTPYLGMSDLIFSAKKHNDYLNTMPWLVRLGGVPAKLEYSNWIIEAKYAGLRYNSLQLTMTATSISISGLEPNYPQLTYTGNAEQVTELIYRDYLTGISPIKISQHTDTIPTLTAYLSGGLDGEIDADSVDTFFDIVDIPADVTHVLFLTTATSSMITAVQGWLANNINQPRVFMFNAPTYSSPATSWLASMYTALPYRSDMAVLTVGSTFSGTEGKVVERYTAEAVALGLVKSDGFKVSNVSVPVDSFSPNLTEQELAYCKLSGFMCVTRHISTDISTYQGVTSSTQTSLIYSTKVAEILAIVNRYCERFYGEVLSNGSQPSIANVISKLLVNINFFTLNNVEVYVLDDSMIISVEGYLPSEILTISFTIRNR